VRLIPGQFVKPFVKSNKHDFIDAETIAGAVTREKMRFAAIKTDDQLDLQALLRSATEWCTAASPSLTKFVVSCGSAASPSLRGRQNLRKQMPIMLEDAYQNLTPRPVERTAHHHRRSSCAGGGVQSTCFSREDSEVPGSHSIVLMPMR
jgi:transposase